MPYSVMSLTTGSTLNPDPQLANFWATYRREERRLGNVRLNTAFLTFQNQMFLFRGAQHLRRDSGLSTRRYRPVQNGDPLNCAGPQAHTSHFATSFSSIALFPLTRSSSLPSGAAMSRMSGLVISAAAAMSSKSLCLNNFRCSLLPR